MIVQYYIMLYHTMSYIYISLHNFISYIAKKEQTLIKLRGVHCFDPSTSVMIICSNVTFGEVQSVPSRWKAPASRHKREHSKTLALSTTVTWNFNAAVAALNRPIWSNMFVHQDHHPGHILENRKWPNPQPKKCCLKIWNRRLKLSTS